MTDKKTKIKLGENKINYRINFENIRYYRIIVKPIAVLLTLMNKLTNLKLRKKSNNFNMNDHN